MEKINETNKPKYTYQQFFDAYLDLSVSTRPDSFAHDHNREIMAYFKEHPEEALDPNGVYDSVELVLEKIREVL